MIAKIKNKKSKAKMLKNTNKGITLIALVITIIVLLILAGVSIATLTGENGILTQASTAKEKNSIAGEKESIALAYNAVKTANKGGVVTAGELNTELASNKINATAISDRTNIKVTFNDTNRTYTLKSDGTIKEPLEQTTVGVIVKDKNKEYTKNGTAIVPVGFMVVPGLDDVSEGLVISDDPGDTEIAGETTVANGNQFVWIPATESTYVRNETYADTNISENAEDDTNYLPDGITDEKQAVLKENVNGFYISRYEAGKENVDGTDTLVSKKGADVWVIISQETAKSTAKKYNNANVKSALCSGVQWDAMMAFISSKPRIDGENQPFDVTQTSSTRHIGSSVAKSGQNNADKVCNIYDLEGNAYEYVAERNTYVTDSPCVVRGGYYSDSLSASNRDDDNGSAISVISFRFALYVM